MFRVLTDIPSSPVDFSISMTLISLSTNSSVISGILKLESDGTFLGSLEFGSKGGKFSLSLSVTVTMNALNLSLISLGLVNRSLHCS